MPGWKGGGEEGGGELKVGCAVRGVRGPSGGEAHQRRLNESPNVARHAFERRALRGLVARGVLHGVPFFYEAAHF